MLGMGGSAVLSMALGAQNKKRAANVSAFVTYASLIIGIIFTAVLILFMDPILRIFGADAQTYEFAAGYTFHISYGAPFIIWSAAASFIVRAEGASKEAMFGSMIGTIANIVLDPIFISVLDQGTAGAAIATTIFSALMSVSTIVLNQLLVEYGNNPVAAIGIVFKANMFITFLQMGIANGIQPLLGYNYGSGNMERFRGVESYTKKCCVIAGIIATVLFFIFREPIISLFISDSDVIAYGVKMLTAYMLSGPVIGILFVNMNCMQSVGHAFPATVLSVLRQGILLIPLLYLLKALFGLNGVILGQSLTDYAAVILSLFLWRRIRKTVENNLQPDH